MANTKARPKSKKKNKDDKLSTGRQSKKAMRLEEVEELKFLSPDERIQYLIENGDLIKDRLYNEVSTKQGKLAKQALVRKPNKLISKGKLGNRSKNIEYMDSILMRELLIHETPTNKHDTKTKRAGRDNNNDTDLSDQNNSIRISTTTIYIPNETEKTIESDKTDNANKTQINKVITETIQIDSSSEVDQTKATNVAKNNKAKKHKKAKLDKNTQKILTQRLKQVKKIPLGTGVSLSITPFECDHCKIKFCSKSSLQRHMLMHLNLKPISCPYCPDKKFRQKANWRVHMSKSHPQAFEKIKYMCRICQKSFHLREHLKLHQKAHAKEKQKRYKCVFCEKVFKSKLLFTQHEKQHMIPGRYKCTICSMSYDSRSLYSIHLKSHAESKDYSCQFCGKSYLRPSSLVRHIQVSHGGMRLQCPVCYKLLRGHLTEHMRTHEKQRPHECDECGQKFTQSTQLTVHKRSHSGARPYSCRICNQPFSHSNALMLHIRRHTGEKPFVCAMCPLTFSQLPHMKSHMRSIHRKTEFYKCNNCNSFFKFKASLVAHAEECEVQESDRKTAKAEADASPLVSRMRFLLALLFTMITTKEKLYDLGFNKRLIDDILVDSIEAMGLTPCKDHSMPVLSCLRINVLMLLQGTIPKHQMNLFIKENKSTEEILELLTDENSNQK